jgi:1,5-anhydro-D-fructose reductase (1,5-anhydro-D-mannitol-forming)
VSSSLGWGIVGTGRIADGQIAPAITAGPWSRLAAVTSRDQGRAAEFAARHGAAAAYDDYAAMLADPQVRAVYIATPNAQHADQVRAAAAAGKHVLCDKPLAIDTDDARDVVAACARAGVRLGVTFQTRFHGGMADVRQVIAKGDIGAVVAAHVEMGGGRTLLRGWRQDPAIAGVGTMNNIGVHAYDLLRYLLAAEITEVSAMVATEADLRLETTALALLRFSTGALAGVQVNQAASLPQADLVVYGTDGRVVGTNVTRPGLAGTIAVTRGADADDERRVSSADAYRLTVDAFADAVRRDHEPSPSGVDGLVSVRVTEALRRSAEEERTIRLDS